MAIISGKDKDHPFAPKFKQLVERNRDTFLSINGLSKAQGSEFATEMCLEGENTLIVFNINSDHKPMRVSPPEPNKKYACKTSLLTHTHPGLEGDKETGRSRFSPNDLYLLMGRLEDPIDPLSLGCVQGLRDNTIKCLVNPSKHSKEYKDTILEMELSFN